MSVFNGSRSYIIRFIFLGVFLIIIAQLVHLQLFSDKYKILADENARTRRTVYPPRGIIFDRKNRAILNNTMMNDLMVVPSEVKGVDTSYLCQLLEIDTSEFRRRVTEASIRNTRVRPSVFEELLSPEKYARLLENEWRLGDGFYLQQRPVRTYPYNAAAHIMGYVGEADSAIIARSDGFYQPGDYVGRSGLEAFYEPVLMGQRGVQFLIKDNKNRLQGAYGNGAFDTAAEAGRGLRTYLDIELQQLAEKLMQHKVGAIVAIEPKTGGILAMVSAPDYNPNDLTGPGKKKNYSKMVLDVSGPLLNRAINGRYPAGSTYKPLGALVALDEGVITPRFGIGCNGAYYGCNRRVGCTEKWSGHSGNLRTAIAYSCNSYFSHIFRLTVDNPRIGNVKNGYFKWKEYVNAFGLGHRLGVDIPSEASGLIPDTAWYNKTYHGSWNSCTNVSLGIGQGEMTVTPVQMANAMCIIANKGYYYTPHLVKSIDNEAAGDTILSPFRRRHEALSHIPDSVFEVVHAGMHDVTVIGTARAVAVPGINICAKTGTAENFRIIDHKRIQLKDNSLFAAFAPRENPQIAIAVIVENGGFGATWAAPMASLLIEKYLTDSIRESRKPEIERIASANLMPSYLPRLQFIADSARGYYYFNITQDSAFIKRFVRRSQTPAPPGMPPRSDSSGIDNGMATLDSAQKQMRRQQQRRRG